MESKSLRRRINVSRGMKGAMSFECTCEAEGYTRDELLIESDFLVAALEKRYPAVIEEKKEK